MNNIKLNSYTSLLNKLGSIQVRSMFGFFGIFINDTMVALFAENTLYVRTSTTTRKHYQKRSLKPYSYMKNGHLFTTNYFELPKGVDNQPELIISKVNEALIAVNNEKDTNRDTTVERLKDLPNLQMKHERMLKKIGINSTEKMRQVGALKTYMMLQKEFNSVPLDITLLWILEGAITGVHWATISPNRRNELLKALSQARVVGYDPHQHSSLPT